MTEISITKDAACLLKASYKAYKKRRHNGRPKQEAVILGDSSNIRQEIMSQWSLEDIDDACWELDSLGFLSCLPGDDTVQMAVLTDDGIAYAEGRFPNAAKAFWSFLREILPFIPSMP